MIRNSERSEEEEKEKRKYLFPDLFQVWFSEGQRQFVIIHHRSSSYIQWCGATH